ncbi:MAG: DUF4406 domain-containing protein [Sphingobacteriales bacterium]|jgi:hypothetical protein|nr:DUF4406 domain-containing protein [Sphingobacteriales bacterium]
MKKAFISGPVSGKNPQQVAEDFEARERILIKQGYYVVNPVWLIATKNLKLAMMGLPPWTDEQNRREIMGVCISWLALCDEIHMLPDWQYSEGACIEHKVAAMLKMKIVY